MMVSTATEWKRKYEHTVLLLSQAEDKLEAAEQQVNLLEDQKLQVVMDRSAAERQLQRIKNTLDCYDEREGTVPLREFLQALLKE